MGVCVAREVLGGGVLDEEGCCVGAEHQGNRVEEDRRATVDFSSMASSAPSESVTPPTVGATG
ncbi:MAG: hypothetical protein ACR2MB_17795, partial [Acidimicrobiales bacterium]